MKVLIASSNSGKLRDFSAAARAHGVEVALIPNFGEIPEAVEDGTTFEENARKKAEHYSHYAKGTLVLADDSGLEVDALDGAPGVTSARYAAGASQSGNSSDEANNSRLLRELDHLPQAQRTARFVCVISAARDGREIASFRGEAEGQVLTAARGTGGFGYDPLFYFPSLKKTFAELSPEEKANVSHRGAAFRKFLEWCDKQQR
ncbi:MAG TPA: RdgB/HAM1 family non-canonical purine NTP pyrophosphatase [candidate division Zixibacteria bacterium]|nr:RdgB/HAM1 family non-canonical purine NTP pyrophosphatase [candidate division Zixibacteria bacterium]